MLDMGFKLEVETIMRYLPKERQTLLFSATVPDSLRSVMAATMRAGFETVDCIGQDSNDEDGQHTNSQVIQAHVVLTDGVTADSNGTPRMVTGVVEILYNLIQSQPPVKMIVFFPTSQLTSFYSALFNNGLKIPVMELHARKTQAARTATSKRFRSHPSGILFTTDVSARGVDYPDVTHVVQVRA
jgi:ATP-dependent RNA helicase MSS116